MLLINGLPELETTILEEVEEIEGHIHNNEIWLGNAQTEDSLTGFTLTSGNADFGNEVLLLDTGDTPIVSGKKYFDLHRVFVTAISNNTPFYIRLIYGTGTVGAAESARQYTTMLVESSGVGSNISVTPSDVIFPHLAVATKVWAKCKNATNLATVAILIGLHEYD